MKKFIMGLISLGLVMGSTTSALMTPVRLAKCIIDEKKYQCTVEENNQKKVWLASASVAAVIALLAVIGITVGPAVASMLKEPEASAEMKTLGVSWRSKTDAIVQLKSDIAHLQEDRKQNPQDAVRINQIIAQKEEEIRSLEIQKNAINRDIAVLRAAEQEKKSR